MFFVYKLWNFEVIFHVQLNLAQYFSPQLYGIIHFLWQRFNILPHSALTALPIETQKARAA